MLYTEFHRRIKDSTYCRVRYSSQSILNSHVWNSTDRHATSFKHSYNTLIIFLIFIFILHTSNTYFWPQAAYVTLNSNPALLLGIYYKSYSRRDATQFFYWGIYTRATVGGRRHFNRSVARAVEDHQGQVSRFATRRSSTRGNCPK